MHSVHVSVTLNGEIPDVPAHLAAVVSEVSSQPGFIHGYWLVPKNGKGDAYTFFDTEENARASAPELGPHGRYEEVTISGVELCAVAASA
jgi:hypothetical protein